MRRFKFTIATFVLFFTICCILFADFGPGTWWYVLACAVLLIFVFLGELLPR